MLKFTVGEHVKVHPEHWLRPKALGQIIEIDEKKRDHCYLVKFRERFTGGGIRGESLWLTALQLQKLNRDGVAKKSLPKAS